MRLSDLLHILPDHELLGKLPQGEVTGLAYDSRKAGPGVLFAALKGVQADGHSYVKSAAEAGALAALVEEPVAGADICQIKVPHSRAALSLLAHRFHGEPSKELCCIALTGTNGKTTTSYLIEAMLEQLGPVGVIGTVDTRFMGRSIPAEMTTPESADLMANLADMRGAGVKSAVLEISSHALEQRRADGMLLDAALFTNLSRDHLDYHGDMRSYFQAKARLFVELLADSKAQGKKGLAICGWDDEHGRKLAETCRELGLKTLTFGFGQGADIRGVEPEQSIAGSFCRVIHPKGEFRISTRLVGGFNLLNILGAAAMGLGLGLTPDQVQEGLESLPGVPGRLQRVGKGSPHVFVDYSHTPDALEKACAALKPLCKGRLICVFGAGGDRDQGKRPLMGRAACQGADLAVVTSDNPRSEDPRAIIAQIQPGLEEAGCKPGSSLRGDARGIYINQPDREAAIHQAITQAGIDDVVLIAGKGHEDYQIVGENKRHFDDCEKAGQALAARSSIHPEAAHA